jgi:hypothetical protein
MKNFSGLTITGATPDGYSVKANGYVKGSWLQSSVMQNYGSNTGKVCVFDNSGWIYYRTPAEIVAEAGGSGGSTEVVQTTGTSTTSVMSQKATTDELAKKANLNGGNNFTGPQRLNSSYLFLMGDDNYQGPLLDCFDEANQSDSIFAVHKTGADAGEVRIGDGIATAPVMLCGNAGTSGQVLTSQGPDKTPIWADVSGGGSSDNSKHGYTQLTNEDLNTITEAGWYRAASGNTCTNRPSRILSTDPFVLEVEKSTDVYTKQTLYMTGNSSVYTTAIYFRMKGSSWSTWQESALVYKGVDQTFSGRKTFSSGINLQGSLQANGSAGTAGQVLTSTGSGTPEWKDISGSADAMPTIRLVSIKDTTGTGICGPNNPLRFSFVVEKGTLLDTDVIELCSRTLFTYKGGHYLNYWGDGGVQDFGRTYKLRAFHQIAASNLTLDNGIYKFEIGGTNSNYALRQLVRSNRPGPSSKSPYTIIKYFRVMRQRSGQGVPKNIHSNVIPIHVAPTKPVLDASTNMWSVKIRIR